VHLNGFWKAELKSNGMMRPQGFVLVFMALVLASTDLACGVESARGAADPAVPRNALEYTRCKKTHRCPNGFGWYDEIGGNSSYGSKTVFEAGLEEVQLFENFESWKKGTRGWWENQTETKSLRSHFSTFDFGLLGPLQLSRNESGYNLVFNTDEILLTAQDDGNVTQWNVSGFVGITDLGTEVAVFNFEFVDVGANVRFKTLGSRPLTLLSRSSIRFGANFEVEPGTLGGFSGGSNVGTINLNGPGSASTKFYLFTVKTSGDDVDEVQKVSTSASPGQNLKGSFTLKYLGHETHPIPHDSSPALFKSRLERATRLIGDLHVTRGHRSAEGGYTWEITFLNAIGDLREIQVAKNDLNGDGADVSVTTIQDGNEIGGNFTLTFRNQSTIVPVPADATSETMSSILKESFEDIIDVFVQRSSASTDSTEANVDKAALCRGGGCHDGPGPANEYIWTISMSTHLGIVTTTSPRDLNASQHGTIEILEVFDSASLTGQGAAVHTFEGHQDLVHAFSLTEIENLKSPFTVSLGGYGASFRGTGRIAAPRLGSLANLETGLSRTHDALLTLSKRYSRGTFDGQSDLIGGSGGAIGGIDVKSIVTYFPPAGRGGPGGGAVEISALNDIELEQNSLISTNGGSGASAFWGGGGGSGGTLRVFAGGSIVMQKGSLLASDGGQGGQSTSSSNPLGTSDGSGGLVQVSCNSFVVVDEGADLHDLVHSEPSGEILVQSQIGAQVMVDMTKGAAGTTSSLKIQAKEKLASGKISPVAGNGATFTLPNQLDKNPERISMFFMFSNGDRPGTVREKTGMSVHLYSNQNASAPTMIGTAVNEGNFVHGANFFYLPPKIAKRRVESEEWHKLDILINWRDQLYSVRLNDEEVVVDADFSGAELHSFNLGSNYDLTAWFDQVFVGFDDTGGFRCPRVKPGEMTFPEDATWTQRRSGSEIEMIRPEQHEWDENAYGKPSEFFPVEKHESHLSKRSIYVSGDHGIDFGGGGEHINFNNDVGEAYKAPSPGVISKASLLHVQSNPGFEVSEDIAHRSKSVSNQFGHWTDAINPLNSTANDGVDASTGRYFWYGEHLLGNGGERNEHLRGGVMACSTNDFITWRNEGTMFHFSDLTYNGGVPRTKVYIYGGTDSINTNTAGFQHEVEVPIEEIVDVGNWTNANLTAQRPKVLFNNESEKYVMWMTAHDESNELGLAAVAQSEFPGGPFEVIGEAFLPDGNETFDQTILQPQPGLALLVRTYFATVDYILPEAVLQPLWESVKDDAGEIDFGLSYHRAFYHEGYDDSNDICIQRVRQEDLPFETVVLLDDETIPALDWIRNAYNGSGILENFVVEEQSEPWRDRMVLGQGNPVVTSRFRHPSDPANNAWVQDSVPAVKAQTWEENFFDDNIADNPPHPTVPDKLIGPPKVVEQRRSKYIAVSLLTANFLNTTGVLNIYEGRLEGNADLASVLTDFNQLNLKATLDKISYPRRFFPDGCEGGSNDDEWENCNNATLLIEESTYAGQVWALHEPFNFVTEHDWSWRYHQYRSTKADLASAPVNFLDQISGFLEPGAGFSNTTRGRSFFRAYDHNCFRGPNEFPEGDARHISADPLFNNSLSQYYLKTEGANISETTAHLRHF